MIFFRCPACQNALKILDEGAGSKINCPYCGQRMLVPAPVKAARKSLFRKGFVLAAVALILGGSVLFGIVMLAGGPIGLLQPVKDRLAAVSRQDAQEPPESVDREAKSEGAEQKKEEPRRHEEAGEPPAEVRADKGETKEVESVRRAPQGREKEEQQPSPRLPNPPVPNPPTPSAFHRLREAVDRLERRSKAPHIQREQKPQPAPTSEKPPTRSGLQQKAQEKTAIAASEKYEPLLRPAQQSVSQPQTKSQLRTADAIVEARLAASEVELSKQLFDVPELRLVNDLDVQVLLKSTNVRSRTADPNSVTAMLHQTLVQAGLNAGLPLRGGAQARLQPAAALVVEELSKSLRDMGFVSGVPSPGSRRGLSATQRNKPLDKVAEFQKWCDDKQLEKANAALPTLLQMLQVEKAPLRSLLVRELSKVNNRDTTIVLTYRALFDLDSEVRDLAVKSLEKRSSNQYLPFLLKALRYPWPPVADHAAYALRKLKTTGIEPWLIDLLEKPNPSAPSPDKKGKKLLVAELVRLNHMRNCLLCHAPSAGPKDGLVRGLAPTPGKPLPVVYYAGQSGNFVRADTTFLRQDFSVILTVEGANPWPAEQRFDFVVRTRAIKPEETPNIASKSKAGETPDITSKTKSEETPDITSKSKVPELPAIATKTDGNYPQREAVLYALRGLTGKDAGTSAEKWREMLAIAKNDKDAPKDLGSDTQRKTAGNKTPTPGEAVTTKKGNGQ